MRHVRQFQLRIVLLVGAGLAAVAAGTGVALAGRDTAPIGSGVVVIETNLAYQNAAAAGTGIVLTSSGQVLTNNHVISGATTVKVVIPSTGRSYTARVAGYSRTADVALLQLQNASNLKTLRLNTTMPTIGQAVRALGNAGGTGKLSSATGIVTGLRKSITAQDDQGGSEQLTGLIETNAGVVPGDSGGPLLDRTGHVIGMDTAGSTTGGFEAVAANDAYAIPIGKAVTIAKQIASGTASATVHVGATAFLGVQVTSSGYGDFPGSGFGSPTAGALIADVVGGGPAASAGLTAGDLITAINGKTISSPGDVMPIVLNLKPGTQVTVAYVDEFGASNSVTVTLGSGPPQ
jgi:S1-C subfamily serine protease